MEDNFRVGKKRIGTKDKEDRISALPDSIIQHILSFLPSTKSAVWTAFLSKRWRNQWTRVPVLIFKHSRYSGDNFLRFVDNTLILHDCPYIKKFYLYYDFESLPDPQFTSKVRFAFRKCVEELVLNCESYYESYLLPEFLFDCSSLVRLEMCNCSFMPSWRVNWPSLKSLKMDFSPLTSDQKEICSKGIENVVSGCPLLECLELRGIQSDDFAIVSKSLKVLSIVEVEVVVPGALRISCPNLVELNADAVVSSLYCSDEMIENVLSVSPSIHSLKISRCAGFRKLVIASKSVKVLHLVDVKISKIEVSCPDLEILDFIYDINNNYEAMNLPSSISAAIDYVDPKVIKPNVPVKGLLEHFQHVNKLTIERPLFEIVSGFDAEVRQSLPLLNCKCLTLNVGGNFGLALPGIAYALGSPTLETLVIKLDWQFYKDISKNGLQDLITSRLDYWNSSNGFTGFTCLKSHLKTVKIIGLYERDDKCKFVLEFIEFLLKNARVLEKVIVLLEKSRAGFVIEVSQKLLSFPRYSKCSNVELLCST